MSTADQGQFVGGVEFRVGEDISLELIPVTCPFHNITIEGPHRKSGELHRLRFREAGNDHTVTGR